MTPAGIVALLFAVVAVAVFAVLTAVGQQRRGGRLAVVIMAGLFFPLAWISWYTHDRTSGSETSS